MPLAIFDLDNTLLDGDSDYLWGQYLIEQGVVDPVDYEKKNQQFYHDYQRGQLDIDAFLNFALRPLSQHPLSELIRWRDGFLREKIIPIILPAAQALINQHRSQGHTLLVITATNRFVTAPIIEYLGIPFLIATEPAQDHGRYTGAVDGIPAFREGKVQRLTAWLEQHHQNLTESFFYSDSMNDLPLLETVTHPIAVDPDPLLREIAQQRGWRILSLRSSSK
jgi:HAD superfamily hydrolase (TIGR01490 family)